MGFIWYIIIGIVAGFLAGKVMRGGGFGLIINLLLGILGGVLGGWVFALFGLSASGLIGSLITSTVGAMLAVFLIFFSIHGCIFLLTLSKQSPYLHPALSCNRTYAHLCCRPSILQR